MFLLILVTYNTFSKILSFNCYFTAKTIENEFIIFEIYLDAKERVFFSLYGWVYSKIYRLYKKKHIKNGRIRNYLVSIIELLCFYKVPLLMLSIWYSSIILSTKINNIHCVHRDGYKSKCISKIEKIIRN